MSLQDFFDKCETSVELHNAFTIDWSVKGMGFGQFFFRPSEDGKVHISNECCSKEFIKKVLYMMVDEAVLQNEPSIRHNSENNQTDLFDQQEHDDRLMDKMGR